MNDEKYIRKKPEDRVMWMKNTPDGEFIFSFDGVKNYNLFRDYPYQLSEEERRIFDEENPLWAEYFSDR